MRNGSLASLLSKANFSDFAYCHEEHVKSVTLARLRRHNLLPGAACIDRPNLYQIWFTGDSVTLALKENKCYHFFNYHFLCGNGLVRNSWEQPYATPKTAKWCKSEGRRKRRWHWTTWWRNVQVQTDFMKHNYSTIQSLAEDHDWISCCHVRCHKVYLILIV